MPKVAIITESQKNEIAGKLYMSDSYFNPVQDVNDNWVISEEEVKGNQNTDYPWVNQLPLVNFQPKPWPTPY